MLSIEKGGCTIKSLLREKIESAGEVRLIHIWPGWPITEQDLKLRVDISMEPTPEKIRNLEVEQITKSVAGIQIPPQPTILTEIRQEQSKKNPNFGVIASLITRDVSLSAAILKTINSPFYGLKTEIDSIKKAVLLLGINNVANLVTAMSVKNMLKGNASIVLGTFWESASNVANISLLLANRFYFSNPDGFYALGLFHDCGIPMLALKYNNYPEVLLLAEKGGRSVVSIEDEYYNTNHAILGYYLCKSWRLVDVIAKVVQGHHLVDSLFEGGKENHLRNQMMAVLKMAGNINMTFQLKKHRPRVGKNTPQSCVFIGDFRR